jgi:hypothetical protein
MVGVDIKTKYLKTNWKRLENYDVSRYIFKITLLITKHAGINVMVDSFICVWIIHFED